MDVRRLFAAAAATALLAACGPGDSVVQGRVDGVLAHPDNHIAWVTGSVSGGTLTITGMAPSDEAKTGAVSLLGQIPGIKGIVDQTVLDTALVRRRSQVEACGTGITTALGDSRIEFSGSTLSRGSRAILDRIATVLDGCPDASVEVAGHTDSSGSDAANMRVSERRAQATLDYLVGKGVDPERLTAVGHGESQPAADNDTAAGRQANRRVEIHVRI